VIRQGGDVREPVTVAPAPAAEVTARAQDNAINATMSAITA
jgi:hypothetical protein